MDDLLAYRRNQQNKFRLLEIGKKYADLIRWLFLKKEQKAPYIITIFIRRKILVTPINEVDDSIPGLFRLRCHVYDQALVAMINENHLLRTLEIENESNTDVRNIMMQTYIQDTTKFLKENSQISYLVVIDLRIYGLDPDIPIMIENDLFQMDSFTKQKIVDSYNRINPVTISGERYQQMINWSKALCQAYNQLK